MSSTSARPVSLVDGAGVAHLTAALGVEGRAVEHDRHPAVVVGSGDGQHPGLDLELLAPDELGGAELVEDLLEQRDVGRGARRGWRASLARCFWSAMASANPASSTSTPRSRAISRVSSSGKPWVSCSRKATAPGSGRPPRQRVELAVEDGGARLERLAEPLLFVGDDVAHEARGS